MAVLVVVLLAFAGLVWLGRRGPEVMRDWRPASAVLAMGAMVAAAAAGVRGVWPMALVLMALAAWLATTARKRPVRRRTEAPEARMSEAQARALLGVGADAGPDEIQAAWLRLMRTVHPDRGGTSALAAQINAARDRLLG
jgi:hypothetical protein